MKGRLLLDIVIGQSATILQLFTGEDKTLLVWWDTFFILNFCLDVFDGVRGFDFEGNGLSGQGLDENLHTTSKTEYQMEGRFLLDVIVGKCSPVFQLFTGKDKTLLVWWDSLFVLDLGLDVFDGVRSLDLKGDRFSGQGLDEDLHTASKSEYQMKGGLLLNVVVREGSAIFELFTGENETLLVWWDTFFILDFCLDVFNGIRCFDFKGDGFSC